MPTITPAIRKYSGDQIYAEPFCSRDCCQQYHGVQMSGVFTSHSNPERIAKHIHAAEESKKRRARNKSGGLYEGHAKSAANYRNGCRCDECRAAYRIWQVEKRAEKRRAAV
jgi:hypothetical protein